MKYRPNARKLEACIVHVLADERALCRAPSSFWSAASHHPFALPSVRHIFPSMAQQYDAGGEDREDMFA